jgi:transcriptional regulator with XRE-family HTH domain
MGNKRKASIKHDEVVERFAHRLRELRVERGMTQAELAQKASVTTTYVSKLESAGSAPGLDLLQNLATALGVGITELVPISSPEDNSAVAREQARKLFDALMKAADQQTLALLNPFLALLVEAAGKRGGSSS